MDNVEGEKIDKLWKTKGKNLKKPDVIFAEYSGKLYYVIRDDSFIILMIPDSCNTTYAIPKKYSKVKTSNNIKYYSIKNFDSASVVSCPGKKSKLESFVIENINSNPKC